MRENLLDKQTVRYTLKRSSRARYIRLEVGPDTGLVVVFPKRCKLNQVNSAKSCTDSPPSSWAKTTCFLIMNNTAERGAPHIGGTDHDRVYETSF
jgi:hypothetical protein